MVHHVTSELDAGKVINEVEVPIYENDDEKSLKKRIQYFEKPLLIQAIQQILDDIPPLSPKNTKIDSYPFHGKVRDIYEFLPGYNQLSILHSNRLSAFDRAYM